MRILIIEPGKRPREAEIPHTLESLQSVVGGYIQAIYPWEDRVAVVCDEEGLLKHAPFNRLVAPGNPVFGTFFICGLGEDDFTDLPQDMIDKYTEMLGDPEMLIRTPAGPVVLHLMNFGMLEDDDAH